MLYFYTPLKMSQKPLVFWSLRDGVQKWKIGLQQVNWDLKPNYNDDS